MTTAIETDVIIDGPGTYLDSSGDKVVILRQNAYCTCWVGVSADLLYHSPFRPNGKSGQAGICDIVSKVSDGIDL